MFIECLCASRTGALDILVYFLPLNEHILYWGDTSQTINEIIYVIIMSGSKYLLRRKNKAEEEGSEG